MFKKFVIAGALVAGLVSMANAQLSTRDVNADILSDMFTGKLSKGTFKAKFSVFSAYYVLDVLDPAAVRKEKATGNLYIYVSSNSTISPDDRLITVKKLNLKAFIPKYTKISATLTSEDAGKYLLAYVESPQDTYHANDLDSFYISPTLFSASAK